MENMTEYTVSHRKRVDFTRPYFSLFGVAFDCVSMEDVLGGTSEALQDRSRLVISTPNVNNIVAAKVDPKFRDSIGRCNLIVADGMPLVWVARLLGIKARRIAGSDFFERLAHGDCGALKIFFFGGPEGVASKASNRLSSLGPGLQGVGGLYPGFGSISDMASQDVVETINSAKPDFLIVALGTAKGQAWIEQIQGRLAVPLISHLGAVVNFAAGSIRRAPRIFQISGLEWVWRIWEEPGLWRRYYSDGKVLIGLLVRRALPLIVQRLLAPLRQVSGTPTARIERTTSCSRLLLEGPWRDQDASALGVLLNDITQHPCDIEVSLAGVTMLEQSVVALLIRLRGQQQLWGRRLVLSSASESLRKQFILLCAEYLLDISEAHIPLTDGPSQNEENNQ